jgi:hypothetical protein
MPWPLYLRNGEKDSIYLREEIYGRRDIYTGKTMRENEHKEFISAPMP